MTIIIIGGVAFDHTVKITTNRLHRDDCALLVKKREAVQHKHKGRYDTLWIMKCDIQ